MTSPSDHNRLRQLASEYAEIVNSADMDARRERWRLSNRLRERTVPFQIEDNGSFFADLTPPLECEGEAERGFEGQLLHAITNHRLIPDVRWIMEHAAGRRFIASLLDKAGVDSTTFTGNSDGHRLEGRRQIGLEVQDEIKQVAFDNFIKMLVEKRNG